MQGILKRILFLIGGGDILNRNIGQLRVWTVCHWLPVVGTDRARHDYGAIFVVLVTGYSSFNWPIGFVIPVGCPVNTGVGLSRNELACAPVKDKVEAVFRRLHDHITRHS